MTAAAAIIISEVEDSNDNDDDDDVGLVWLVGTSITQSLELNESSIVGQLGSISRVIPSTRTLGLVCTHWLILVTMLSASAIEVGTSKVIIARYTTESVNSPWDPWQLKAPWIILLEVNSHEQCFNICLTISALISLCFWSVLISYIQCIYAHGSITEQLIWYKHNCNARTLTVYSLSLVATCVYHLYWSNYQFTSCHK